MKMSRYILIFCALGLVTPVMAADSPVYVTLSGGETRIKRSGADTYSAATTVAAIVGYRFYDTPSVQSSLEAQYEQTAEKESAVVAGTSSEYKQESLGLFLSGWVGGDAYLRARIGAVQHRITTDTAVTYDHIKAAAGIGFGFRVSERQYFEVNYTAIGSDVTTLNMGFRF